MPASTRAEDTRRREDLFVAEYIAAGMNPEKAAIAAGYSAKTAKRKGLELAKRLRDRIDEACAARAERVHLGNDEVLRDMASSFRVDRRQFFNADGTLKPPNELTEEQARLVESFEVTTTTLGEGKNAKVVETSKIKIEKHIATREQAMKHLRLFPREEQSNDPEDTARRVREFLGNISALTNRTNRKEKP